MKNNYNIFWVYQPFSLIFFSMSLNVTAYRVHRDLLTLDIYGRRECCSHRHHQKINSPSKVNNCLDSLIKFGTSEKYELAQNNE